jgi:hypothetical protein
MILFAGTSYRLSGFTRHHLLLPQILVTLAYNNHQSPSLPDITCYQLPIIWAFHIKSPDTLIMENGSDCLNREINLILKHLAFWDSSIGAVYGKLIKKSSVSKTCFWYFSGHYMPHNQDTHGSWRKTNLLITMNTSILVRPSTTHQSYATLHSSRVGNLMSQSDLDTLTSLSNYGNTLDLITIVTGLSQCL